MRQLGAGETASLTRGISAGPTNRNAVGGEQAMQFGEREHLGGAIKIDEQVAAENEIVGRTAGEEAVVEHVRAGEGDAPPHGGIERVTFPHRDEIAFAKFRVLAAKGIFPVDAALGTGQGVAGDVHSFDLKTPAATLASSSAMASE